MTATDIIDLCGGVPDVIWASPDCTTFSIAAISHHRKKNLENGNLEPVSDYAKLCDCVDQNVLKLINELQPKFYFIENPRGGMRKMEWMQGLPRYTITYCQYEQEKPPNQRRMKPTDIWTNHPEPAFKPMCKNGDPCHAAAPRGAVTGTQGIKGSKNRSIIPDALCQHIVDICEKYINKENPKMELRVKEFTIPEVIDFNFDELKQELQNRMEYYQNAVYTEEQTATAKKDLANLRKFNKALSDERIRIKKECLKPYEEFEAKVKELSAIVDKPINLIDRQLKDYEEQRKEKKLAEILHFYNDLEKPDWLTPEKIFKDVWLNKTVKMAVIEDEIKETLDKIEKTLVILRNLPDFSFEATEEYKHSLDFSKAVETANKLKETAIKKAEAEQAAKLTESAKATGELRAEQAKQQLDVNPPQPQQPPQAVIHKNWVCFKALLSTDDAFALKQFFNDRNIEFHKI